MSWLLLPSGEIASGVVRRVPDVGFETYGAEEPHGLSEVEFYVPPYMGGDDTVALIQRLPNLRVIQTLTIGVDWIREHVPGDVTLCNAEGVHEQSTAELIVTGMLCAIKDIPFFVHAQAAQQWEHRRVGAVAGATVLILGQGAIGSAVAERLAPFGVETIGVTRSGRGRTHRFEEVRCRLPEVDVLIITVPLTSETKGMVNAELLARLPRGAIVLNAARGQVVEPDALFAELASGRLRAVLDVTEPEPLPPQSPLWTLPNVLITPHVGGDTTRFPELGCDLVAEQVMRYRAGRSLLNQVDLDDHPPGEDAG